MGNSIVYVGLDYHQNSVQVCVMNKKGKVLSNRKCANDLAAIISAVKPSGASVHAAIEVCTGAADLADDLVLVAGWSVDLAHPGYVKRMKASPDKTDYTDARMLADLERVGYVPRVWLAPAWIRDLRALVHHRAALAQERRRHKQRIGAALRNQRIFPAPAKPWTKRWLAWLRDEAKLTETVHYVVMEQLRSLSFVFEQIRKAEERLEQYTQDDPLVARLMAHKGIGLITACAMRASIGRFDRFHSGKQLSRFCGLSPRNASSGQRQATSGLIHACDRQLRAILIEAAHRLKRFVPHWREMAERMKAAKKPGSVIAAAVANRWMRRLYHEMKPLGLSVELSG